MFFFLFQVDTSNRYRFYIGYVRVVTASGRVRAYFTDDPRDNRLISWQAEYDRGFLVLPTHTDHPYFSVIEDNFPNELADVPFYQLRAEQLSPRPFMPPQ